MYVEGYDYSQTPLTHYRYSLQERSLFQGRVMYVSPSTAFPNFYFNFLKNKMYFEVSLSTLYFKVYSLLCKTFILNFFSQFAS